VAAYLGWQRYVRQGLTSEPSDTLSDAEVIVQFGRRQRIHHWAFFALVLMFAYVWLIFYRMIEARDSICGLPIDFHLSLALALMGVCVVATAFVYRCPRCGERPWTPGRRGLLMNPDGCESCGARLK
jgi:uncharacterized membrane protein YhdT